MKISEEENLVKIEIFDIEQFLVSALLWCEEETKLCLLSWDFVF